MEEKDWFPIDTRIFPIDFSFKAPISRWAKRALLFELLLAFLSVIGTLILVILPPPNPGLTSQATTEQTPKAPPVCQ